MNVIKSEWIKLTTTKSVWWTSALIILFAGAFAALTGLGAGLMVADMEDPEVESMPMDAELLADIGGVSSAVSGVLSIGVMIIIIQSVINVTNEYSTGVAKATALGTPKRIPAAFAKFFIYGLIAAILSLVSAFLSIYINKLVLKANTDNQELLEAASFSGGDDWNIVGRLVLYAILAVLIATGVGYLVRSTAGGIAALLLWILVIEGAAVQLIPKIRDWVPPYMPFQNMENAVQLNDMADAPWGQTGSMLYFAAFCVILFIAGLVALKKRDA